MKHFLNQIKTYGQTPLLPFLALSFMVFIMIYTNTSILFVGLFVAFDIMAFIFFIKEYKRFIKIEKEENKK